MRIQWLLGPFNDGNGSNAGHVRIYEWTGAAWQQKGADIDGEAAAYESGQSVSMPNANTVAVGATQFSLNNSNDPGQVRIYDWDTSSSAWIQRGSDIDGEAAGDQSGCAVSMPDANTVAIGATGNNGFTGHVRIYEWTGTVWQQKGVDMDGEAGSDFSGYSVSMPDANTVGIGAPQNDGNGGNAGHVRVYNLNTPEIEVVGNGLNLTDGQTTISTADHTDFGDVIESGSVTETRTFTIRNIGTEILAINAISSSDPTFSIGSFADSILVGDSTSFAITFDPSAQATFTSTISIDNNDADENPFTFDVEGVGVAGTSVVELSAGEQLSLFPNPVRELVQLQFSNSSTLQEIDIRILNNLGQVVYQGRRSLSNGSALEIREVATLAPGSYYLQVSWAEEEHTLPFVKQ